MAVRPRQVSRKDILKSTHDHFGRTGPRPPETKPGTMGSSRRPKAGLCGQPALAARRRLPSNIQDRDGPALTWERRAVLARHAGIGERWRAAEGLNLVNYLE